MVLNAPVSDFNLTFPVFPGILVRNIHTRPRHMMGKFDYLRYAGAAAQAALTFRPHVVYASDPLGAAPALAAAKLANAQVVYHEHDSPRPGALRRPVAELRKAVARRASVVIFPNPTRAHLAQTELGFDAERLRIVWNVPRRSELPQIPGTYDGAVTAHYHGNISPHLLPACIVDALARCRSDTRLQLIGYEAAGGKGYLARVLESAARAQIRVHYLGQMPRDRLLEQTASASVGLALVAADSGDLNLRELVGASNKVFDYMAAGLPVLVPNSPEWISAFVKPGYGRSCDPDDGRSIAEELDWFAANREVARAMGERARAKIEAEWNYDTQFLPVLHTLGTAAAVANSRGVLH